MAMIKIPSLLFRNLSVIQRHNPAVLEKCRSTIQLQIISNFSADGVVDTPGVKKIQELLKNKFPQAKSIEVVDISGGCGQMYEIFVETIEFKGMTELNQHRLINETLKNEIKQMHGLRIETSIPKENT